MSQEGILKGTGGSGAPPIETITGNSGGPVGPDAAFNINLVGNTTMGINVVGNAALNTLTIIASQATTTQFGVVELATNADAIAGTDTAKAITSDDLKAKLGTQTIHGVAIGNTTSGALSWTTPGALGQILTSNGPGSDPSFQAPSGSSAIFTITGNTGGPESPLGNNFNILGTGSITVAGSANTETVQLTGLTNHAVLVGAGTATITNIAATANTGAVLQNNSGADPSYSTATYPSTTTINQILYSSAANTVTGLATANRAVLTTSAAGVPVLTALAADGQLIIGSTAGAPAASTLTAGVGISITNASNSITISSAGAGLTWTVITADQTAAVGNGYICNKGSALLLTLPATAVVGDTIRVTGINTALGWKIVQNANQQIFFGNQSTTLGATGFLQSAAIRDSVELVCVVAGASTVYNVISSVGNITVS